MTRTTQTHTREARREARRERRRDHILNAAHRVVGRRGLRDMRLEDVAGEAGYSIGTLYLYFRDREELLSAMLERLIQSLRDLLTSRLESCVEPVEQLRTVVHTLLDRIEHIYPVLTAYESEHEHSSPVSWQVEALENYLKVIEDVFSEGIRQGQLRDFDVRLGARLLGQIACGAYMTWRWDRPSEPLINLTETLVEFVLHGLARRDGADRSQFEKEVSS